jgi:hypothetical protein
MGVILVSRSFCNLVTSSSDHYQELHWQVLHGLVIMWISLGLHGKDAVVTG